jgi:RHS repeat-associated protein
MNKKILITTLLYFFCVAVTHAEYNIKYQYKGGFWNPSGVPTAAHVGPWSSSNYEFDTRGEMRVANCKVIESDPDVTQITTWPSETNAYCQFRHTCCGTSIYYIRISHNVAMCEMPEVPDLITGECSLPECPEGEKYNPDTQQCESVPYTPPLVLNKTFGNCTAAYVGNPIHAGTGNKFQKEVDLSDNNPNGIRFVRYYNSLDERVGVLGSNWRHNYDRRVVIATDGSNASVIRGDAKTYTYTPSGTAWQSDPDVTETLTETATGWTYTTSSGTVEEYDNNGLLVALTDSQGKTQSLSYDAAGKLTTVTDAFGHNLTFSYDEQNRIAQVASANGNIQFSYDANNNLQQVTYPDATTRQYLYENTTFVHALTGIIDENNNRYATWSYDAEGRSISSEHANGVNKVSLTYNADGTTTVTNSRNINSTYSFIDQHDVSLVTAISGPGCSSCGTGESIYQYDPANNNLLSKTIHGLTTEYGNYDTNGNPGFMIKAKGTTEERRTDFTYDPRFASKVKTVTAPSVYASGNKVTSYDYDEFGNTTRIRVDGFTAAGTPVAREFNLQYLGPLNQLSQIDGPRADVSDITTLDYYPNDPAEGNNRARLKRVTSAGIVLRDNLQYSATGKLLSESRPNGLTLTYSYYPGNDRLQTVTENDGTIGRSTQWTYLASGEVETITRGYGTPDATSLTFDYDDARRLTRVTDGLGNYIQYTLDTEGNKQKEDIYDVQDVLRKSLTQTFDDYNRLNLFSQANEGSDSDFAADGTLDKITDGNGTVTDYSYDALKRLVATTQDLGGTDTSTQNALTQYGYDVGDHLISVIDPNNGNTTYVYDDLGNLLSQTSPDTGTTTFTHDAAGNVLTRLDAKGQSFAYNYDAFNRLTSLDVPGTVDDITYTYDSCANGIGRLCNVVIGDGAGNKTVTYTYAVLGDVTSHQGIGYSHDNVGRIKTFSYPSGNMVTYTYDAAGRVSQVDLQQGAQTTTLASGISYAPFGPVTALTYGNGHTLSQGVDSAYRYTDHTVTGALQLVNSLYDANGNLSHVDNSLTAVSSLYSYDALNRLDTANGSFGSQDFGYDKNGNRLQLIQDGNTATYAYEANSNRLDVAANDDVVLDANGNITTQGLWTYTHTAYNRLASVNNDSVQVAIYVYNGLGQRISKTIDSVTHTYVYGPNGELLQETDGTSSVEYIYLNGLPLAAIQQGDVYYIHNDHLGTPRAVTDATKTVVWRWDSDPFGATVADEDPDNNGNTFILNLRFPGQYYDNESGLHYNYFRYYDPRTGRYITSDPIGLTGGLNTYGYVEGNPVRSIDPSGLYTWEGVVTAKSASAVGGAIKYTFSFTSECVNGERYTVSGFAGGAILGLGGQFGATWDTVKANDSLKSGPLNPNLFSGYSEYWGANGRIHRGPGMSGGHFGKVYWDSGQWWGGKNESDGIDLSVFFGNGNSWIQEIKREECTCETK